MSESKNNSLFNDAPPSDNVKSATSNLDGLTQSAFTHSFELVTSNSPLTRSLSNTISTMDSSTGSVIFHENNSVDNLAKSTANTSIDGVGDCTPTSMKSTASVQVDEEETILVQRISEKLTEKLRETWKEERQVCMFCRILFQLSCILGFNFKYFSQILVDEIVALRETIKEYQQKTVSFQLHSILFKFNLQLWIRDAYA